jgi:hypothetical protein
MSDAGRTKGKSMNLTTSHLINKYDPHGNPLLWDVANLMWYV